MQKPIYLDYAATTPADQRVIDKMLPYMGKDGMFGNPSSANHLYGWQAKEAVEKAREQVAEFINADPREIVWTSGATEADNLAIIGVARYYQDKGKHIITMTTEHKAVLDSCHALEAEGFEVTYLDPEPNGLLDIEKLKAAIRPETILVSVMYVNNEIGVVQDINAIGELVKSHGILFHVDAVQGLGKLPIDVKKLPVDLMCFSAHKVYGPKGIGALYVRRKPKVRLTPMIHGGGQELGMRSGTLAVQQIVGMGEAFVMCAEEMAEEVPRLKALRDRLWDGIKVLPQVSVNGCLHARSASNLNVTFNCVDGEALVMALRSLAVSQSSACSSATIEPSYVLKALGLTPAQAFSSLRISVGRYTSEADVDFAISEIVKHVNRLREMSPLWEMAAKDPTMVRAS